MELFSYRSRTYSLSVGARIHIQVIDPKGTLGYRRGGIGASLASPRIYASISPGKHTMKPGDQATHDAIIQELEDANTPIRPFSIRIKNEIPKHVGLGSGSVSNVLSRILVGRFLGLANDIIFSQLLSSASLTGVSLYSVLNGGLVIVGGVPIKAGIDSTKQLKSNKFYPPLLTNIPIPRTWRCVLCIPRVAPGPSGIAEKNFYNSLPSPNAMSLQQCAHEILARFAPAVFYGDFKKFTSSMNIVTQCNWKCFEAEQQADYTQMTTAALLSAGALFVGVTSCGPTTYTIIDSKIFDVSAFVDKVSSLCRDVSIVHVTEFSEGFQIENVIPEGNECL